MMPAPTDFTPYLAASRGERPGKAVAPARAFDGIADGARVLVGSACGMPTLLLEELARQRGNWTRLELVTGQLHAVPAPARYPGEPFTFTSLQPSDALPARSSGGRARVVPARYSDARHLFLPGAPLAADAVLVQVSPPGPEGRFSLGLSVGGVVDAVRSAPLVIAQVNPRMPYTFGAGELRRDEIDVLVEMEGELVELRREPPNAEARAIAAHVLAQVPDGATLQFGIGAIPEALMSLLGERRDLGVHSGMISDGIADLVDSGAITNARKTFDGGVVITAEVLGTRRLFDWAHRNPALRMAPAAYSHGVAVVSRCARFVSIQSALQVALDGSINAESIGDRQVGGPGGQPDFVEAAAAAPGGIAIHALPATAAKGRVSRIVPRLDAGAIVTTPRYLADRVVTEFGVAHLRGRTLEERADALCAIAHPAFREDLAPPRE
ncbi:MAG: acetyl-CoA hydrolase/transferase family protein [Dehalococcoidia bacterium]|nr:acetyl-CoA hydrolase/transferase family protein [Dehalococcoidia bacterium]